MEDNDHGLLRQFAAHRSEDAFRQLVNRHVGMVFGVARRVTDDPQLAEEVAQTTFATLAQKAGELRPDDVPAGWLYHTARHLALRAVRSEQRRRQREHLAATMNTDEPGPSVVAEHLESAMDQLPPADRDALVLRFFEDRNLREVGHELGLTEDAARMRVNRALEKLRGVFGKLGITGSAVWLGTTLTTSATVSVPSGLGASITTAVLSGTAIAATTFAITQGATSTMNLFNLKTAAAILGAVAVTGTTTYLAQEREAERLRADYQTLNATHAKLASDQSEAFKLIQLRDEQIAALKKDVADIHRLRGEVDGLNRQLQTMKQIAAENLRLTDFADELQQRLLAHTSKPIELQQTQEELQFRATRIAHINNLKLLALAIRIYANGRQGSVPDTLENPGFLAVLSEASSGASVNRLAESFDPGDYEQVYAGNLEGIDSNTILIRQREAMIDHEGNRLKVYALVDGSVQSVNESWVGPFEQFERAWTQKRGPLVLPRK